MVIWSSLSNYKCVSVLWALKSVKIKFNRYSIANLKSINFVLWTVESFITLTRLHTELQLFLSVQMCNKCMKEIGYGWRDVMLLCYCICSKQWQLYQGWFHNDWCHIFHISFWASVFTPSNAHFICLWRHL